MEGRFNLWIATGNGFKIVCHGSHDDMIHLALNANLESDAFVLPDAQEPGDHAIPASSAGDTNRVFSTP
jgi:hypothetical protein